MRVGECGAPGVSDSPSSPGFLSFVVGSGPLYAFAEGLSQGAMGNGANAFRQRYSSGYTLNSPPQKAEMRTGSQSLP